jgi:hypothetical protein
MAVTTSVRVNSNEQPERHAIIYTSVIVSHTLKFTIQNCSKHKKIISATQFNSIKTVTVVTGVVSLRSSSFMPLPLLELEDSGVLSLVWSFLPSEAKGERGPLPDSSNDSSRAKWKKSKLGGRS